MAKHIEKHANGVQRYWTYVQSKSPVGQKQFWPTRATPSVRNGLGFTAGHSPAMVGFGRRVTPIVAVPFDIRGCFDVFR